MNKYLKSYLEAQPIYWIFRGVWYIYNKITKKTRYVVILGSKGSGKTTLWNKLRNIITDKEYIPTDEEVVESFVIKVGDIQRRISSTKDIGGDDLFVSYYGDLIKENGTFIFFLVDLTRLEETSMEVKARLAKISSIIKEKKLSNCGCKILATNLNQYKVGGFELKYGAPISYVKKTLGLKKLGFSYISVDESILPIELTDDEQIEKIKEQIVRI